MKQIKYVASGEVVQVEDQVALDAIVNGTAIADINPFVAPKAAKSAPEKQAVSAAPEIK
jgi:hypothetical protein